MFSSTGRSKLSQSQLMVQGQANPSTRISIHCGEARVRERVYFGLRDFIERVSDRRVLLFDALSSGLWQ